jgi:hypothetical protein
LEHPGSAEIDPPGSQRFSYWGEPFPHRQGQVDFELGGTATQMQSRAYFETGGIPHRFGVVGKHLLEMAVELDDLSQRLRLVVGGLPLMSRHRLDPIRSRQRLFVDPSQRRR